MTSEADAALYEAPFAYVIQHVKPERIQNRRPIRAKYWWRHGDPQPAMRTALKGLPRYIATPEVAKHRIFTWLHAGILPDKKLIVIASYHDATFGILHSRFHELWALAACTWHGAGNDPRYTPSTTLDTFPSPAGLTPNLLPAAYTNPAAEEIATAAQALNNLRENWLNPSEWVEWVRTTEEEKAGLPVRPIAKPGHEADLKKRTLTNLYNARPTWLDNAHKILDAAVAKAYGWNDYTPEMHGEEILRRLLELNQARAIRQ
jgi:type II restriction/modification system DNA methylase subunit YeeA